MKTLLICFVWPEPGSSAAGLRTMDLIDSFRGRGWEVSVSSPCQPNEHRDKLEAMGVRTAHFAPNDPAFDAWVRELGPGLVVFDRFMIEEQFGWRVREQCPGAARVLDTSDLHSLRRARQRAVEAGGDALSVGPEELATDDAFREVAAILRCDLSFVVSDFERELLAARFGVARELVALSRLFYPEPDPGPAFDERRDLVVIGNFRHPPNLDSFRHLQRDLWGRIRARLAEVGAGQAEVHVYGAYPTKELMALDDARAGFRVKGWAPDARSTLSRYRVNLAPLRYGAGIKGKVSDGWSVGTPCAATAIAAEGMHEGLPFGGFVEDDWDRYAAETASLYADPARWEAARERGAAIMRGLYGRGRGARELVARIEALAAGLPASRARNFTGQMLWHQSLRSTEYFSRWIEAKNSRARAP